MVVSFNALRTQSAHSATKVVNEVSFIVNRHHTQKVSSKTGRRTISISFSKRIIPRKTIIFSPSIHALVWAPNHCIDGSSFKNQFEVGRQFKLFFKTLQTCTSHEKPDTTTYIFRVENLSILFDAIFKFNINWDYPKSRSQPPTGTIV